MSRTKIVILVVTATLLALICGVASLLFARLHELDTYKEQILAAVRGTLNRQVTYEKGDFSFRFGPSFTFSKVVVKERDGSSTFITADRLSFKVALLPLLEKKLHVNEMVIDKPTIQLIRNKDGGLNISDLLEEKKGEVPFQLKGLRIKDGRIVFTDHAVAQPPLTTILDDTDFHISQLTRGKKAEVKLSTTIAWGKTREAMKVGGTVKLAPADKPLLDSSFNLKIVAKGLDAAHYWPYYGRFVPFQPLFGRFDLDSKFDGRLAAFTSKGAVNVEELRFSYPQVFHALLAPRNLHFTYDMELKPGEVNVKSVNVHLDGLNAKGSCAIRDIGSGDPRIVARTTIAPLRLEKYFYYIPFGIIAKDVSEFIEKNIKAGLYRVDDARLDGKVSQILHMEKGENYNILSVRARALEDGLVDIGGGVPTFNSIKGDLELAGKDFSLKRMSGRFGTSPFTLDGRITDYPLDKPSTYPFTSVFSPQAPEAAWLLGKSRGSRLSYSGASTLHLNGEGPSTAYVLSGDWNLSGVSYSFPQVISKPAGHANNLAFKGTVNHEGLAVSSFQYALPPLSFAATAGYHPKEKKPIHLDVKTNQFAVGDVAPMLPRVRKYLPQGKVQASVHGESASAELADLGWSGEVNFAGASFKPSETVKTVSNVNGAVRFKGDSLETSRLAVMLGSSSISGKGTLNDFDNPTFTLEFSSPVLDTADLGLRHPKGSVKAQNVQGSLSFHNDTLSIRSLTGKLNDSALNLKGSVEETKNPRIDLTITSTYLDLEDIMLLTELEKVGKGEGARPRVMLQATVAAEAGRFRKIPYKRLRTDIMYEDRILYLQPFEFSAFGGKAAGRVRADFGSNGTPRYQANVTFNGMSAEELVQTLDLRLHNEIITGTASLQADVTAKGETAVDLKKTILGSVRLHVEDGRLRKYSVLSKIFSILNVSQLLKFQLPDMVANGMPYNEINADLSIRDGVISTSNLFIDSDAMNVSAVGKIDLVKEDLDVTIGVKPLQTVDKVINRIPIVGWILTGKDKSFITAYFEAKGKWNDPTVKAIPVKSMARGVFDIFKRVFQLPKKIVTDTGEVLIGK